MNVTLGLEEELQVVDKDSYDPKKAPLSLKRKWGEDAFGVDGEMHACVFEIQTPICRDTKSVVSYLANGRLHLERELALDQKTINVSAVHPFACWTEQEVNECQKSFPHYNDLLNKYGSIAKSAMSYGTHVHLKGSQSRLPELFNITRSLIPEVMALSASSPFYRGHDTGLCSWRFSMLGRYPRTGVPDVISSIDDHLKDIAYLRATGCLGEKQQVWYDVRLHEIYETVEMRVMDATADLHLVKLICDILLASANFVEHTSDAVPFVKTSFIEENKWRARKDGMSSVLVDWATGLSVPVKDILKSRVDNLQDYLPCVAETRNLLEYAAKHLSHAERQRQEAEKYGVNKSLNKLLNKSVMSWLNQETLRFAKEYANV